MTKLDYVHDNDGWMWSIGKFWGVSEFWGVSDSKCVVDLVVLAFNTVSFFRILSPSEWENDDEMRR